MSCVSTNVKFWKNQLDKTYKEVKVIRKALQNEPGFYTVMMMTFPGLVNSTSGKQKQLDDASRQIRSCVRKALTPTDRASYNVLIKQLDTLNRQKKRMLKAKDILGYIDAYIESHPLMLKEMSYWTKVNKCTEDFIRLCKVVKQDH